MFRLYKWHWQCWYVLFRYGDHYEWNKAVTCIQNVFSQQRWLEHYGDVIIRNVNSDKCTCKITFIKVSLIESTVCLECFVDMVRWDVWCLSGVLQSRYWGEGSIKNEVQGTVLDRAGKVVHRFGGSWHEGIFCDTLPNPQCIWKPSEWHETWILLNVCWVCCVC